MLCSTTAFPTHHCHLFIRPALSVRPSPRSLAPQKKQNALPAWTYSEKALECIYQRGLPLLHHRQKRPITLGVELEKVGLRRVLKWKKNGNVNIQDLTPAASLAYSPSSAAIASRTNSRSSGFCSLNSSAVTMVCAALLPRRSVADRPASSKRFTHSSDCGT